MNPEQKLAYDQSVATADQSTACLERYFELYGKSASMIDIGCGDGHLVKYAAETCHQNTSHHSVRHGGMRYGGADICVTELDCPKYGLLPVDLTMKWPFDSDYALTLCLEVAEHLPETVADTLCDTLATVTASKGRLLFSAATPGQGGAGHINEQQYSYWIMKLDKVGFCYSRESTVLLRNEWTRVAEVAWWYGKNVMVFDKAGRE